MEKQLRESLIFMSDHCPSEIKLKECNNTKDNNGFPICEKKCIECWINALDLDIDLISIDCLS